MAKGQIEVAVHTGEMVMQAPRPALWRRALSYLWAHKKQLGGAVAVGVAAGKAGAGWLDVVIAAAKALVP